MIPGNANPLLLASAAADAAAGGPIKSVRFDKGSSGHLNRTFGTATDTKKFTISFWVKRVEFSQATYLFSAGTGTQGYLNFDAGIIRFWGVNGDLKTNAVYRDPAAWYHIVAVADTANSTTNDRMQLYVNGVRLTDANGDFSKHTQPSSSATLGDWNSATTHYVNRLGSANHENFYMADFYFIDGQAKEATDFGAFDNNGVWQAATYSGTIGTNGFHLFDFANESGIGNDSSGNDNDWTVNNITTGNTFSTNMTPSSTAYPNTTLSNGGLSWTGSTANDTGTVSSLTIPTNKKTYVEVTHTTTGGGDPGPGVAQGPTVELGLDSVKAWWRGGTNGSISASTLGSFTGTNTTWSNGDVLGIALDNTANSGAGSITFYKNGTQIHTGGSGWTSYTDLRFEWQNNGSGTSSGTWNYGASAFSYPLDGHTGLFEGPGADEDVLFDVPTNGDSSDDSGAGGEVSGNYPTWNPLDNGGSLTLSNGNLDASNTGGTHNACRATFKYPSTGKWYYEAEITTLGGACCIGVDNSGRTNPSLANSGVFLILVNSGGSVQKYNGSSVTTMSGMGTPAVGGILQVAYDADADKLWLGLNNNWMGSGSSANGNPGAGTEASISSVSNPFPVTNHVTSACAVNFGQRSFSYSAPTNFKPLCTTLLPTPTIADGSEYFDIKLWTGDGNTGRDITSYSFSPDFVWIKQRNATRAHALFDTIRGANKRLRSDASNAEATSTNQLSAFLSNGFTIDDNNTVNVSSGTYVGWAWDAPTSTASNTDGDITSQVKASQTAGFSIVKYTGSGTSNDSVGHGLNAAPELIITKNLDGEYSWRVLTTAIDGSLDRLFLNGDHVKADQTGVDVPTSSVFSVGSNLDHNKSGDDIIAYCFASVDQYSRINKYTGNGSSDGTFVYTGFKPAFVAIKSTSVVGGWRTYDSSRKTRNVINNSLHFNTTETEAAYSNDEIDFLSNGFKPRATGSFHNGNGTSYIYYAVAENPFQANGGLAR